MRVEIAIDRLALTGLPPEAAGVFRDELARLLSTPDMAARLADRPSLPRLSARVTAGTTPVATARAAARAVAAALVATP